MKWDDDLIDFKVTEQIDNQIDVIKYEMYIMPPQSTRCYSELRTFRTSMQLPHKYSYVIFTTSIDAQPNGDNKTLGDIIAITLRDCYVIEANENKTKLFRLYRGDYRYEISWS
jgi:hypothetical protein